MSARNSVPPALEPFLRLPPETSLILLTGTLGCSPNWLVTRFLSSTLHRRQDTVIPREDDVERNVLFVSWMRDLTFWKAELRRAAGLDISKYTEQGRFVFIDQLTTNTLHSELDPLNEIEVTITEAIGTLAKSSDRQILLVLDGPEVLLVTNTSTAHQLNLLILKLRTLVQSTLMVCSADMPHVTAATQTSGCNFLPLEVESARFVAQQGHNARYVLSMRGLDTGAARDVSGVLRVTRAAHSYDLDDDVEQSEVHQMEALYLVQRDGSVKLFERGAHVT